jgi:peptidoglycan/LPS O-acetylase OafA/YrhL
LVQEYPANWRSIRCCWHGACRSVFKQIDGACKKYLGHQRFIGMQQRMKPKLQWIEAMRGLAACWVLVHHADLSVTYFAGPLGFYSTYISNGYLGVDFFFVLSGFIIAYSSNKLLAEGKRWRDYAIARLIRIYVPYLPIGVAMLLLYRAFPGVSAGERVPGLLTSLTLAPSNSPPALSVAWTLVHELVFYAVFSIIFISRKYLVALLVVWAASISLLAINQVQLQPVWRYLLAPINLCFLLGVATYYITRNGVSRNVAAIALALGVAKVGVESLQTDPKRWLLALGFTGLIVAASSSWTQSRNPSRILLTLGAGSYSIYLIHNPAISIAVRVIKATLGNLNPLVVFLLISCIALACGMVYYLAYERWALERVRQLCLRRPN